MKKIEDIKTGKIVTIEKVITNEDLKKFVELTGDNNLYHTDQQYALAKGHENILVHGMLLSSIASFIAGVAMGLEGAILASQKFEFFKPVYVNKKIVILGEIKKVDLRFNVVNIGIHIKDTTEELVAKGEFVMKF